MLGGHEQASYLWRSRGPLQAAEGGELKEDTPGLDVAGELELWRILEAGATAGGGN